MLLIGEIIRTLFELMPICIDKSEASVYVTHNNNTYTIENIKVNQDKEIEIEIMER